MFRRTTLLLLSLWLVVGASACESGQTRAPSVSARMYEDKTNSIYFRFPLDWYVEEDTSNQRIRVTSIDPRSTKWLKCSEGGCSDVGRVDIGQTKYTLADKQALKDFALKYVQSNDIVAISELPRLSEQSSAVQVAIRGNGVYSQTFVAIGRSVMIASQSAEEGADEHATEGIQLVLESLRF